MTIENNVINYAKIDQNGEIIVPKTSVIGESENILIYFSIINNIIFYNHLISPLIKYISFRGI